MSHYDVNAMSSANPATVYRLLLDGSTWPRWSPIDSYEPGTTSDHSVRAGPGGPSDGPTPGPLGQVRVFRTGRNVSREEIVEVVPDRRLVYAMLSDGSGLLRDYRGEVDLEPQPGDGTRISWRATWRSPVPIVGWLMERYLSRFQQRMVLGLARYAEVA